MKTLREVIAEDSLDKVRPAIRRPGYNTDGIKTAKYSRRKTKSGDEIHHITFHDPDSRGGVGKGKVYLRNKDGNWHGDF